MLLRSMQHTSHFWVKEVSRSVGGSVSSLFESLGFAEERGDWLLSGFKFTNKPDDLNP